MTEPTRYDPAFHQQRLYSMQPQMPPPSYYTQPQPPARAPRRKRRVFLWVFLAIQLMFIIWLIAGTASTGSGINASVVAQCHHQAAGMGMTQAQCVSFLGGAAKTGTAIGAGLVVVVWLVVDFFLGVGYVIYKLASR